MPTPNLTTSVPATNVYVRADRMTDAQVFALVDLGLILLMLGILLIEQRTLQTLIARASMFSKKILNRERLATGAFGIRNQL